MKGFRKCLGIKSAGVLLLLLLFTGCGNRSQRYIVPEKKFKPFLVDLYLAEAIGTESRRDMDLEYQVDSASLYGSVFKKHNISQAMFDSTMLFYSKNPDKFQRLFNAVTADLKKMEQDIAEEQKKLEGQKEEILWRTDSIYRFPPLTGERIAIDVPLRGPGIYTVSAVVKMLPEESSLNPRMSVYFYRDNGTPSGEKMFFQEIRYVLKNGESKIYRAVKQLDSTNYTHLRGYIVNYSNYDSLFQRNMIVKEIRVSKRKEEQ